MSVLTFAHRDECWKKGKNPFNVVKKPILKEGILDDIIDAFRCGEWNPNLVNWIYQMKEDYRSLEMLKGGVKRGNRK